MLPSGPPSSRGLYGSSVHRPLLLGPKGLRPWRSWEFSVAMGTLNMSGRLLHTCPLQVLGLLPAAARRCLISGMRSLGVLVGMLHPFGGVPLPSTRGWGSTPWCRCFLGLGDSEPHTAGSEGRVTRRVSVHPVGASLPTLYSAPTANGMRNAFPRVGKTESSSEHSVSSG